MRKQKYREVKESIQGIQEERKGGREEWREKGKGKKERKKKGKKENEKKQSIQRTEMTLNVSKEAPKAKG